ncbi:peptidase C15 [Acuticoccus kandeliae]|uniref:pyroglutamyl-peptidase I family protein n=1 Tax=Acuticoccus kandeliae TaxID=2073160 RepID=UPI000D3E2EE9|nr:peptidase C15 [Acuticoccus kandeliae]
MKKRTLVTGFGPFPGMPDNPTSHLVRAIAAAPPAGIDTLLLATEWDVCGTLAAVAADYERVLMFGVAGRAHRIRYERVSLPDASRSLDAAGRKALAPPPRSHRTRFDVDRLAARARAAGFPVVPSSSAGTYICNASYGAALGVNPRTLFVHVPLAHRRGPLSLSGLERHAAWLLREIAG